MGLALAALLAGAVGCTGGSGDAGKTSDSATAGTKGAQAAAAGKACANGTYTWINIEKPTRLLGVSDVETLGKGGGTLKHKLRRLATVQVAVQAGTGAPAAKEILTSLGRKIGEIDSDGDYVGAFTKVGGQGPELNDDDGGTLDGAGRFVHYAAVRVVEADFRYACPGGKAAIGHAESWTVPITGVLECGESTGNATAREAARLSCGADSVAAKAS
ncbi:hypothetical protein OG824_18995 [Streptomyces prunicolor]|uniref:hypothetical protein n=1 Tax=Streptomyces prunicolor TaxID=67348 RepID=UPI002250D0FD|nr:hypothetical protein [Streptomyces prunicolor]MCX5237290.1 hypothetical protein [Streptomyces prunicolor]